MQEHVRSRLRAVAPIAVLVVATGLLRLPLLDLPLERDEGGYAYIAWRAGEGEVPYRDWFDQKPPGIFAAYALALALPLDSVAAIRLVAAVASAATSVALLLVARRFLGGAWPLLGALLFGVLSAAPGIQGPIANTERFLLLPLVLAHLCFLRTLEARGGLRGAISTGLGVGLATLFKQVGAVDLVFFAAAYPLLVPRSERRTGAAVFAAALVASAGAAWAAAAVPFAAAGALGDFVDAVLLHNLSYARGVPAGARLELLAHTLGALAPEQALAWIAAALGASALGQGPDRWRGRYLVGWLAASLVGASASGYYFPHYFQQTLPALALLAAGGAATLAQAGAPPAWRRLPAWLRKGIAAAALLALPTARLVPFLATLSPAQAMHRIYPGNAFEAMPELARRIAEVTPPDGRVFVFGAEPELFLYARRLSASRFIYLFPLYGPYPDVRARQERAMEAIVAADPDCAVVVPNDLFFAAGSEQELSRRVEAWIRSDFEEAARLVADASGAPRVALPAEQLPGVRVLGALYVRRR